MSMVVSYRAMLFVYLFFSLLSCFAQGKKAPNIILMIGDGMGLAQLTAGMYADEENFSFDEFKVVGLMKTDCHNKLITDSAASGTAMACGVKTNYGAVGVDKFNTPHKSILEICHEKNYRTALVVTSSITHATPAAFYAHVSNRKRYEEIAFDLIEKNIVDLFVGGGKKYFNRRSDGVNLLNQATDYTFMDTYEQWQQLNLNKIGYFLANDEPPSIKEGRSPGLETLVSDTLNKLEQYEQPFFLMVEGSQIDWGGHENNWTYVLSELNDFNRAVRVALDFAQQDENTLIIVTADHETGGLSIIDQDASEKKITVDFSTEGHTPIMVPVFCSGPAANIFSGIYHNTQLFYKMLTALSF